MRHILISKADGFISDVDSSLLDKDPRLEVYIEKSNKRPSLVTNRLPYNGLGIVPVEDKDYEDFAKEGWKMETLFFNRKTKKLERKKVRKPREKVDNCQACGADISSRREVSEYAQYCFDCLTEKRRKRSRDLITSYRQDPDFKIVERYKILGIYYKKRGKEHAYKSVEDYAKYLYEQKGITSKWFPGNT